MKVRLALVRDRRGRSFVAGRCYPTGSLPKSGACWLSSCWNGGRGAAAHRGHTFTNTDTTRAAGFALTPGARPPAYRSTDRVQARDSHVSNMTAISAVRFLSEVGRAGQKKGRG